MPHTVLDEYLKQVQKYLPPWNSEEILLEIRSHVLDQAEGLAAGRGVEVDEAILREALACLGPPQRLAAGYVPAVTLIRPEYTLPFAIYSVVACVLLLPLVFAGGPLPWIFGAIVAVGLLFVGLVGLSRLPKVYRLPIWHSRLPPVIWKLEVGRGLRRGVHAIWPQPAMAGLPVGPAPPAAAAWSAQPLAIEPAGGLSGASPAPGATPASATSRRTPTEWLIAHSGPRPLRIHELFGAGMRAVFGLALALFFVYSAAPFPILDLSFDDPRRGWRLLVQGPGLDAVRELGAIACLATCVSGLLPIFLGKCRLGVYASIASKLAWAALFYQLMVGGTLVALDFQTTGWVENDWPQVKSAILSGLPLALGIALVLTLLALVGCLVKLGM
ncbi:MAG TPA: hypothetical protein VFD43_13880, partial [Planctomycetota bacterium]|nr:hypothetical protein [Planctomycetota bacterium]